jgi:DNA-binding beta-propeller fold protein YncE
MKIQTPFVTLCALSLAMPSIAVNPAPTKALTSVVKGSIDLDAAPLTGGAEIPAFDPVSKRAFTSSNTGIQVIDLTNPAAPAFIQTIAPATLGVAGLTSNDVSSVAVRKGTPGILAAAIINSPKTNAGHVVFLNATTGALLGSAVVGSVPDNITFTPDGTKLLVANEAELDGAAATIPDATLGTVSIIDLTNIAAPVVTTADFTAFDAPGTIATLKADGVRIFANGVPSTDFEPEYIAVSPDGTKAMVTLQEANAVGILDVASATFTAVKALGKKNFSLGGYDFSDRDGLLRS